MQAVVIVLLFGFAMLGMLAYRTYTDEPPIPTKVVTPDGRVVFTGRMWLPGSRSSCATD